MHKKIIDVIKENLELKIIAVVLALLIWFYLRSG